MLTINNTDWKSISIDDVHAMLIIERESFYFEWKADEVSPDKLIKEVSAFANTYGGYIFLGITDDGELKGCRAWDEQRIHNVINNRLSPLPPFDVKQLMIESGESIYVIRIQEGPEPPYVTNKGGIYERVSSGSIPIKDSARLIHLYNKRHEQLEKIEKRITIPEIKGMTPRNVLACIDIGFMPVFRDGQNVANQLYDFDLSIIARQEGIKNVNRTGDHIVVVVSGISCEDLMPAHANTFMEIGGDGSVRLRILIINNKGESTVNMSLYASIEAAFRKAYQKVYGRTLEEELLYAWYYSKLTTFYQFHPTFSYTQEDISKYPEYEELNNRILQLIRDQQAIRGVDTVITDERWPSVGLWKVNRDDCLSEEEDVGISEQIVGTLLSSPYIWLGFSKEQIELMGEGL